jgi:hypothetical protein
LVIFKTNGVAFSQGVTIDLLGQYYTLLKINLLRLELFFFVQHDFVWCVVCQRKTQAYIHQVENIERNYHIPEMTA